MGFALDKLVPRYLGTFQTCGPADEISWRRPSERPLRHPTAFPDITFRVTQMPVLFWAFHKTI
jgi:hypothetical protein